MAQIIINNKSYNVDDNSSIETACREAGVPFNCHTGVCASCLIKVTGGGQNLNSLTQEEYKLGLENGQRLACQCVISSGTVKVEF